MPEKLDELDLQALVDGLLLGRISLTGAEAIVANHAPSYRLEWEGDLDEYEACQERRQLLVEVINGLIDEINEETNPHRAYDVGRLAYSAGKLLGIDSRLGYDLGCLLSARDDDRGATWFFEAVEAVGGQFALAAASRRLRILVEAGATDHATKVLADEVVNSARKVQRADLLSSAFRSRSMLRADCGQTAAALTDIREALAARKSYSELGLDDEVSDPLLALYDTLQRTERLSGRFADSIRASEQAREKALALSDARSAAWFLAEIGYTWAFAGDSERSDEVLDRAAREFQKAGLAEWGDTLRKEALTGSSIPRKATLSQKFARARQLLNGPNPPYPNAKRLILECLTDPETKANPLFEALLRNALAEIYRREGCPLGAEIVLREAISIVERLDEPATEFILRSNLAQVLFLNDRFEAGEKELTRAIEIGESLRAKAKSTELRQTRGGQLASAYDLLALLEAMTIDYSKGNKDSPRPARPEQLFLIGQRSKGVNLGAWLRLGEAVEACGTAALVEPVLHLRDAEINLEAAALEARTALGALWDTCDARRADLIQAAKESGVTLDLDAPPPVRTLAQAAAILMPGDYLVDLLALNDGVSITGLGPDGQPANDFVRWSRDDRLSWLDDWTIALRKSTTTAPSDPTESGRVLARLNSLAKSLEERLFDRLAELIGVLRDAPRRLLLLPHRELFQFPFWRLTRMFQELAISIVPCTEALFILGSRRRVGGERVAFGDASSTLPGAAQETGGLLGFHIYEPTKDMMLQKLPEASLCHFACHGRFDAVNPYRSGLMIRDKVSFSDNAGSLDDGLGILSVAEIVGRFHLPLCRLAVLSACRTGLPREHPASEFTSLPAALLVSGARNVLASLWAAHDQASAVLMREFYAELESGKGPSLALARARRRVATLSREQVRDALGKRVPLPEGDFPLDRIDFLDAFQHYGID